MSEVVVGEVKMVELIVNRFSRPPFSNNVVMVKRNKEPGASVTWNEQGTEPRYKEFHVLPKRA